MIHDGRVLRFSTDSLVPVNADCTPRMPIPVNRGKRMAATVVACEIGRERYRICVSDTLPTSTTAVILHKTVLRSYNSEND